MVKTRKTRRQSRSDATVQALAVWPLEDRQCESCHGIATCTVGLRDAPLNLCDHCSRLLMEQIQKALWSRRDIKDHLRAADVQVKRGYVLHPGDRVVAINGDPKIGTVKRVG